LLLALGVVSACTSAEREPLDAEDDDASASVGGGGGGGDMTSTSSTGGVMPSCDGATKHGPVEGVTGEVGPAGLSYDVRTPLDYDPNVAHPLLVVYAPYGVTQPSQTEQFTGLTPAATARGYLVAYINHTLPNAPTWPDAAAIPTLIHERWCIDESRIYLTGHSDGASVASVLVVEQMLAWPPAAIAPSAAGASGDYLGQFPCPPAIPVMVLHSSGDSLFPPPAFGHDAAQWWSGCASCAMDSPVDGCAVYAGCQDEVEVRYCEGSASHGTWPAMNDAMLDFFDRFPPVGFGG
jgi:polyhydroxybutyrate depolymerase